MTDIINKENSSSKIINENEKSLLSVVIRNVKGSLSKITGYCAENNMNIERLVMSNFKMDNLEHRVILYITGDRNRINSLVDGLKELDVVVSASNFQSNKYIERELMLVKAKTESPYLPKITDLVNDYNGRTIYMNDEVMIFQFTNDEESNNELMQRLENMSDDIEILKSGVVATSLDSKKMQ